MAESIFSYEMLNSLHLVRQQIQEIENDSLNRENLAGICPGMYDLTRLYFLNTFLIDGICM